MRISKKQFDKIKKFMLVERKPAKISNQQFLNALLYMIENGCKRRALPKKHGNWRAIYIKLNQMPTNGTIQRIFEELQNQNIIDVQCEILCLDSASIKSHQNDFETKKSSG